MKISLAALSSFACLLASAPASVAQDTLMRMQGTVRATTGPINPGTVGAFVDAQVGDTVTLDVRILPDSIGVSASGGLQYSFDPGGSRLTIGTETDTFNLDASSSVMIANTDEADVVSLLFGLAAQNGVFVEATVARTGGPSLLSSSDPVTLQGEPIDLTGAFIRFDVGAFLPVGRIDVELVSVEFSSAELVGQSYCTPVPNSTGATGRMLAIGSTSLMDNDLVLGATALPRDVMGFFIGSQTQGFIPQPGGSGGNLCLGGTIGRYINGGFPVNTGLSRQAALPLDLGALAAPMNTVPAQAGETWNFQFWHRDTVNGQATSNFTEGLTLTFS